MTNEFRKILYRTFGSVRTDILTFQQKSEMVLKGILPLAETVQARSEELKSMFQDFHKETIMFKYENRFGSTYPFADSNYLDCLCIAERSIFGYLDKHPSDKDSGENLTIVRPAFYVSFVGETGNHAQFNLIYQSGKEAFWDYFSHDSTNTFPLSETNLRMIVSSSTNGGNPNIFDKMLKDLGPLVDGHFLVNGFLKSLSLGRKRLDCILR